ncbi:T9SS type A sorting domain-containing protein [Flavobacterium sp.]|uniref:T9SS type A sorting domain-containing protein n=1 Tax=Flavobacterium sp. TaxID=239 RepID=UPI00262D9DAD|nr:T9SS type A sorting domain-containing protein [Flavobacterium sp.]
MTSFTEINQTMKNLFFAILLVASAQSFAQPTTAPNAPTNNPADVVSIYGNTFPNIATNYNPDWGQSGICCTNASFDVGDGNLVLAYLNFNYQGTNLAAQNLSNMEFLHVDVWTNANPTNTILQVTPVNNGSGQSEFLVTINHTQGNWYSVDIPKSAFTDMTWDSVFQMKFAANGPGSTSPVDIYLDNVYFWKPATPPGADPSLAALSINGVGLPNFSAITTNYTVDLVVGTTDIPQVSAVATDPAANIVIVQANALPGTATVVVTSSNGQVQEFYNVNFTTNTPNVAPTPGTPNAEVLNIYSDTGNFTNTWTPDYVFGEFASTPDLDGTAVTNEAIRMNFAVAGYGEGTNTVTDISNYNYVHFDYFADANSNEIRFILIANNGGVVEYNYELTTTGSNGTLVKGAWQSVNVPLSFFQNLGFNKTKFFQFKLGTSSDLVSDIVYFDNIYFSVNPGTILNTNTFAQQASLRAFPNPSHGNWTIQSEQIIQTVSVHDVSGRQVLVLTPNSSEVIIDAASYPAGLYFAKCTTAAGSQVLKLVRK